MSTERDYQKLYDRLLGYWKDSVELLGNDYKTWTKYPKDPYLN